MSSPDQYPQLPDGVAPRVAGIASEFAAIRHDAEEAGRRSPPVISFPPPPVPDTNFIRPEGAMTLVPASAFTAAWTNFGGAFPPAAYSIMGTRVFLRGTVVTSVALTGAYKIFNLPAGFRPFYEEPFISTLGGGGAIRIDVYPNGDVAIAPGTSINANGYVSVSGFNFSTLA